MPRARRGNLHRQFLHVAKDAVDVLTPPEENGSSSDDTSTVMKEKQNKKGSLKKVVLVEPTEEKCGWVPLLRTNSTAVKPETTAKPVKKVDFDNEEDCCDGYDDDEECEFWEQWWDHILGDALLDDPFDDDEEEEGEYDEKSNTPESKPSRRRRVPRFDFWEGYDDEEDEDDDVSIDDGHEDFFNDDDSASLYSFELDDWDDGSFEGDESLEGTVTTEESSCSEDSTHHVEEIEGPVTVLKHIILPMPMSEQEVPDSHDAPSDEERVSDRRKKANRRFRFFSLKRKEKSPSLLNKPKMVENDVYDDINRASSFNNFMKSKLLSSSDDEATEPDSITSESLAEMVEKILVTKKVGEETVPDNVMIKKKSKLLLMKKKMMGASWRKAAGGGDKRTKCNVVNDDDHKMARRLKRWTRSNSGKKKDSVNEDDKSTDKSVGFEVRDTSGKLRRKLWLRSRRKEGKIEVTDSDANDNILSRRFLSPLESEKIEVMLSKKERRGWSFMRQKDSPLVVDFITS